MVRRDANSRLTLTDVKLKLGIIRKMVVGEGAAPSRHARLAFTGVYNSAARLVLPTGLRSLIMRLSCIPTNYRVTREM
jgi:hypothetical protein